MEQIKKTKQRLNSLMIFITFIFALSIGMMAGSLLQRAAENRELIELKRQKIELDRRFITMLEAKQ